MESALGVLNEKGYHAARISDIAEAADTGHGTFYLYFANKEAVIRALAADCAADMAALSDSLGPIDAGAAGRAELGRWVAGFVATYRRYGAVIRAWMEDQLGDDELVRMGLEAFAGIASTLRARMEENSGLDGVDGRMASASIVAMIERFTYYTMSRNMGLDEDAVVDTLTTMIHRGFFGGAAVGATGKASRPG